MDTLKEMLLAADTLILIMLIFGAFIAYEVYSREVPLRWFGAIHRDTNPVFYWLSIFFHLAILVIIVYAWMNGVRIPVADLFD
jgi:preprotein translocase subunit SecY